MLNITSAEELQEYLSDEDNISARDLKILRWYSSLSGNQEIVSIIDLWFEEYYKEIKSTYENY